MLFDGDPRRADERLAAHLPAVLIEQWHLKQTAQDPMKAKMHEAWIFDVQHILRSLLGEPKLCLVLRPDACLFDLGDGRRPSLEELGRGQRAVIRLFAEVLLRVEAVQRRMNQPTFDPWGVVVVDIVERELDPRMQHDVLSTLAERYPRVQWIVSTHSPLVALGLDDATVLDLGRHELRRTDTLRAEGIEPLVARMIGPARKTSSRPPPITRPPPPPTREMRVARRTQPGMSFNDD